MDWESLFVGVIVLSLRGWSDGTRRTCVRGGMVTVYVSRVYMIRKKLHWARVITVSRALHWGWLQLEGQVRRGAISSEGFQTGVGWYWLWSHFVGVVVMIRKAIYRDGDWWTMMIRRALHWGWLQLEGHFIECDYSLEGHFIECGQFRRGAGRGWQLEGDVWHGVGVALLLLLLGPDLGLRHHWLYWGRSRCGGRGRGRGTVHTRVSTAVKTA